MPRFEGLPFAIDPYICMLQAKVSKEYPSHHSATALMALMGAIQATAFALCVEKDWSQWNLGSSIRLLTALFSVYIYIDIC